MDPIDYITYDDEAEIYYIFDEKGFRIGMESTLQDAFEIIEDYI